MANFTKLTPIDLGDSRNIFLKDGKALATEVFTAVTTNGLDTATLGAYFEMNARDDKYLIMIYNAHNSTAYDVTIKAGNDRVFGSGNDLVKEIGAGDVNFIKIDSGRFKNVTENETVKALANVETVRNCVVITGEDANIKVAVIRMPA